MRFGRLRIARLGAVLALVVTALTAVPAHAQQVETDTDTDGVDVSVVPEVEGDDARRMRQFRVGVREAAPFTTNPSENNWSGLSVDLWYALVGDRPIETVFVDVELTDTMKMLERPAAEGTDPVDIIISPLTITADREEVFDFTHQYFPSGLAFAVPREVGINFGRAVDEFSAALLSRQVVLAFLILAFVTLVFAAVAFAASRHYRNKEIIDAPLSERAIVFTVLGALKATGVDKEVFGFRSLGMLVVSILMLAFGAAFSAVIAGLITASLTLSAIGQDELQLSDIADMRVAAIRGSTHEKYLSEQAPNLDPILIDSDEGHVHGLSMLLNGEVDVFIGDEAQLKYLIARPPFLNKLAVQRRLLTFEPYGWAMPTGVPYREELNIELIRFLRSPAWPELLRRYYPE